MLRTPPVHARRFTYGNLKRFLDCSTPSFTGNLSHLVFGEFNTDSTSI